MIGKILGKITVVAILVGMAIGGLRTEVKYVDNSYTPDYHLEVVNQALSESESSINNYIKLEGLNASLTDDNRDKTYRSYKLSTGEIIEADQNEFSLEKAKEVYNDLPEDAKELLRELSLENSEVALFISILDDDSQLVVSSNLSINAIDATLRMAGMSSAGIMGIKAAFSTMITTISQWYIPPQVIAAIVVAAILVIAVIIIINWNIIEPYFNQLMSNFLNAAGKFFTAVSNVFTSIYNQALESTVVLVKTISRTIVKFRNLTMNVAKTLERNLNSGDYLLALAVANTPIVISINKYSKSQIMQKYKLGYSSYTVTSSNARAALRDAYPSGTLYNEVNVGFGVYWHWHVKVGGTKVNGVHSFYGLPV